MAKAGKQDTKTVTVIGAGVVGMACAVQLQRAGHAVTVIDRVPPGESCSFGNAGGIPSTHSFPLALPGTIWKVPGYLFDPLGPLALRWAHLPRLMPWLWRYLRASTPGAIAGSFDAISALMRQAHGDWTPLLHEAGIDAEVQPIGGISPYPSERALEKDAPVWRLLQDRGLSVERLGRDELRQLEPTLSDRYQCAMFEPDWWRALDPYDVVHGLAEHFTQRGGTILREVVSDIEIGPEGPNAVRTNYGLRPVETLVIAAGAWSHRLAAQLGSPVPLESCRGYHITMPDPGVMPRNMVLPPDFQCAITPMSMGLRVAGTAEFAGVDSSPDWRRARKLAEVARAVFPGINTEGHTQWAGDRPVLPDSVPVIGRSPRHANTFYAFGHGFYGLTLGAVTGRLVAELVAGQAPATDLTPYKIDRF